MEITKSVSLQASGERKTNFDTRKNIYEKVQKIITIIYLTVSLQTELYSSDWGGIQPRRIITSFDFFIYDFFCVTTLNHNHVPFNWIGRYLCEASLERQIVLLWKKRKTK